MIARMLTLSVLLSAVLFVNPGCGKSEPTSAKADTSIPLEGSAVSKPKQLVGAWMAVSDGQLSGVEFLKDDQAMLTSANGGTLTLTYSLLDDGRVSLVNPQGQTTIYTTTLSGDTLELASGQPRVGVQRFERLPKGQTLTQGIAAREAVLVERMKQRITALQSTLLKGDVVLSSGDGDDAWVMALRFTDPGSSLDGEMVFDSFKGKTNALSPVLVLPFRAETSAAGQRSDTINIQFQVAPPTEPRGQDRVRGTVRLTMSGDPKNQSIGGEATFTSLWPSPRPVSLSNDSKAYKATLAKLDAQRAHVKQEIDTMRAFLGGRSVFTGQRVVNGTPDPEPARLLIERNEQDNGYNAIVTSGNRVDQPGTAAIEMLLDRAALYVVTPWGEQWRLQTTDADGVLDGLWRPNARADFISYGTVKLDRESLMSAQEVSAERAAIAEYLTQGLSTPQRFVGFVERKFGATNITRWPVSVEVQVNDEGAASGAAWMIAQQGGVTLAGRMDKGSANLESNSVMENSVDFGSFASQRWRLDFAGLKPRPTFMGQLTGTRQGGGRVVLTAATEEFLSEECERLIEALSGRSYTSRKTNTSTVRDEQTNFHFSMESDGRVTAEIHGQGDLWRAVPPAIFTGSITDDHGMPVLKGSVAPAPDPDRGGGQDYEPFEIMLCAVEADGIVRLTGSTAPGPGNQSWFILEPMAENAIAEPSPIHAVRLAALRAGASAKPERFTHPQPGDEALFIVTINERDRGGQLFYADGRYTHRNSIAAAAIHAGLAQPGETAIFRLTYAPPFTSVVEPVEQNGVTSSKGTFRADNPLPSFTIERLAVD